MQRRVSVTFLGLLLTLAAALPAMSQEVSFSPTTLTFSNTYVGKATGSQSTHRHQCAKVGGRDH